VVLVLPIKWLGALNGRIRKPKVLETGSVNGPVRWDVDTGDVRECGQQIEC